MKACFIYMTASTEEEASKIGRSLVEKQLAACVNLIPKMKSIYSWQGSIQEAEEIVLIAKTTYEMVEALTEEVKKQHSYTVPCVVALPITTGNSEYLSWVVNNVKQP